MITRLLDFPPTDFEQRKRWGDGLIDFPWDPDGAKRASQEFTDYLKPIIDERRATIRGLLVARGEEVDGERASRTRSSSRSSGCSSRPGGPRNYHAHAARACLAATAALTMNRRGVVRRDGARSGSTASAVEESTRWDGVDRRCSRASRRRTSCWAGVDIPGGSEVIFGITSANRDPEVFADPEPRSTRNERSVPRLRTRRPLLPRESPRAPREAVVFVSCRVLPDVDSSTTPTPGSRGPCSRPSRPPVEFESARENPGSDLEDLRRLRPPQHLGRSPSRVHTRGERVLVRMVHRLAAERLDRRAGRRRRTCRRRSCTTTRRRVHFIVLDR